MLVKNILIICMILLSLIFVSAFNSNEIALFSGTCFQNLSNVSSSCGGLNTGNYTDRTPSNWNVGNEAQYFSDGDFNTYARAKGGTGGEIKFYYTIPNNATGATINIKLGSTHYDNITIPASCWNWTYFLYFDIISSTTAGTGATLYCATSLSTYSSIVSYVGQPNIWEATITWDMPNQLFNYSIENLTFTGNQNKTRYLLVPSNILLTNAFMNLTGYSNETNGNITNLNISINNQNSIFYQAGQYIGTTSSSLTYGDSLTVFSGDQGISSAQIQSQAFNSTSTYTITQIGVPADKMISSPVIGIEIQYANGTGYPNGSIVTKNYTWNASVVTAGGAIVWYNVTVPQVTLNKNQMYAIIYRWIHGGSINVGYKNTARSATEGKYQSINNGTSWTGPESASIGFIMYNYTSITSPSSNITSNFATIINDYLSGCVYVDNFCYVPITFHSDTSGILNYQNLIFNNSGVNINNISYNNQTYETSKSSFILNSSYDYLSYPTSSALLFYNGTQYLADGSNGYFNYSVDIPFITADGEVKQFYWVIQLTNSTGTFNFTTQTYNQSIYTINMSECKTGINVQSLNFSLYDEITLSRINSWNFKAFFNYSAGSDLYRKNVSFNNLSIIDKMICIRNSTNYNVIGAIQTSATGYNPTDYNINQNINGSLQNISLYTLNVSSTTIFIMQVLSQAQLPLADYYIYVYRYDIGLSSPYLVQIAKTDSDGKTIGYFETYSVDYKFIVTDTDGNVVYTSEKRKIIPESTPYTLTFIVGTPIPSPFSYYQNLSGFSYNPVLTYNKVSGIVSAGYSDSNADFQYAYLTVGYLNNSYNNDSLACNVTSTNPSGYLTCSLNSTLSGSYYAEFHVIRNGVSQFIDRIVFNVKSIPEGIKMLGLLGAFFILLIFGTAFFYNVIAGVISIDIGFIVVELLGLTDIGWLGISGIIGVSVLIIIVLGRD